MESLRSNLVGLREERQNLSSLTKAQDGRREILLPPFTLEKTKVEKD